MGKTHAVAIPNRFFRFFPATSGPYFSRSSRYLLPFRPIPMPADEAAVGLGASSLMLASLRLFQSSGNSRRHILVVNEAQVLNASSKDNLR